MSDPTDPGGVSGARGERSGRNATRSGNSGSPVGSPLTIVLAVIAVAAGFLIFRSIDDSDGAASLPTTATTAPTGGGGATTVAGGEGTATTAAATVTTVGGRVTEGATVLVANASGIDGAAALMTENLDAAGYSTGEPTSGTDDANEPYEASIVYFSVGTNTEAVAQSVARDLGGVDVLPMPNPPPVESLGNALVLVMLGGDMANEDLEAAAPGAAAAPSVATSAPTTAG